MNEQPIANTAESGTINTPLQEGKTFTQDQLNAIVGERLAKEKSKNEAELVKREQELNQRELLLIAKETLSSQGLPADMLEALNCSSKEALEKSLAIVTKHYKKTEPQTPAETPGFKIGAAHTDDSALRRNDSVRRAMGLK